MRKLDSITPSDEQARAIRAIVDWYKNSAQQEFLFDGQAGTGKSTTAGFAVHELASLRSRPAKRVISGAYTAKAAKVMRDKGVNGASTIHKMIYTPIETASGQIRWELDPNGVCASADLIVIDEVSMVNNDMANDLRSYGKKILVLGDVDGQLPPVEGAGAFTNREPDFRLLEINRFALESPIVRLAARARRNQFIPLGRVGEVEVLPLNDETWQKIYRPDTQVICGVHRTRWRATKAIRGENGFDGPLPLRGERLICCRNNYEKKLFNGAFGEAAAHAEPHDAGIRLSVRMEDQDGDLDDLYVTRHLFDQHFTGNRELPPFERGALEFDWGYAITCHKAQGSEWPHVTVIDDSHVFRHAFGDPDLARRWLYTAITRPSQGLTLLVRRTPK